MKKSLMDEDFIDLFADSESNTSKPDPDTATAGLFIPLNQIQPDPDQPRKFSGEGDEDLKLLAESIIQHGILQPIAVQPVKNGKTVKYQIIAGERRWRAAQMALQSGSKCQRKGYDLSRIPVFIRDPESESDKLEMQMVENLARVGMSDTDISSALNRLISKIHVSKAELARRLGRSETWVKTILTRADPDAEAVSQQIGVPLENIGSNEIARLVSWSKDAEKQVILDQIAEKMRDGVALSRSLLSDLEEQYDITTRFPQLKKRTDLTVADMQTWKKLWDSADTAQNAVAHLVLEGMTLAEAMQAQVPMPEPETHHDAEAPVFSEGEALNDAQPVNHDEILSHGAVDNFTGNDDFQIDDGEAKDVVAARQSTMVQKPAVPARAASTPRDPEDRRNIDVSGMKMEKSGGATPVPEITNRDVHVRVPGDMVTRLLDKAGVPSDLTVDADTVLQAMNLLIGR